MDVAIVTGANSGIGMLTTLELLKAGYTVVATMRNLENQEELVEHASRLELTDRLDVRKLDVTVLKDIEAVKDGVEKKYGKLTVLINNAGYCQGGFLSDLTTEEWRQQQDVNVHGPFQMTKIFLPLLERAAPANIINISSVSGLFGFPGMSPYCSSKFALEGLSESLRLELLPQRIFVSLVEPAAYNTKIWEKGLEKIESTQLEGAPIKQAVVSYAQQASAASSDPLEVARLIVKICRMKAPGFRYPIGKGARLLFHAKRWLPWRLLEKIVLRTLIKR
ncbi:NADP-dependent 3-hydroxy acid dehydrogenase YdfG [Evansella caseinilytica]|uniref:NADP-dependent 3-hydroxy acid dehydrogenase YdfG n=1 Tax=Evansella caseinilytica TaxID=1503961 RepID=A0A1H3IMV2_9BACI|nr:SDR family oxidoreductase [Evansella caseinilytica]SDY29153.1 NADP-dependent 3-hydroxy acid dehydrogenase YdfG [Evansella caseinilytica]